MCGRFAMLVPPARMPLIYGIEDEPEFPPRYNVAPTQPILVVLEEQAHRLSRLMRWGFVPGWVKDPRDFPLLINARGESVADKPAFRDALNHGRCIVPASGYYEWRTGPGKHKQPHFISLASGEPMALAALCATWTGPDGEEVDTVATITVAANADLAPIHHRMPAILPPESIDDWLDVKQVRAAEALTLLRPLPPGVVRFHPVSSRVNSARFDDAELLRPVTPEPPVAPRPAQLDLF